MLTKPTPSQPVAVPDGDSTQPRPIVQRIAARRRRPRPPVWLLVASALLGVAVLACAVLSLTLVLLGPDRVLALRDQVLGNTPAQRASSLGEIIQVVVRGEDVWPVPNHGRLTFLLMGVDRRPTQGDAPTRSDAITLLTIDPISKSAALLSIPRDLYVPLYGLDRADRINTAYFFGEAQHVAGGGIQEAKDTIAWNLGIPVDKAVVIDFEGFKRAIDALGGVDVDVPRRIVDDAYPTEDYGVETLVIEAGPIHMNGELALKYVRTRHQDSDFGRLQRQQQVLLAARDKALSLGAISHLPDLLDAVAGSYTTDVSIAEIVSIARVWNDIPRENVKTYRIDESMTQYWTTPGGASVLIPNRDAIAPVVAAFLGQSPPDSTTAAP